MKNAFSIIGLVLDFWGAVLLIYGLIRQQATVLRHISEGEYSREQRPLHKSFAVWFAKGVFSSSDVMDANSEPIVDSISALVWAFLLLCFGFVFQILSYFTVS